MSDLNNDEIQALAKAVGLTLAEPELTQVTHSLNAMLGGDGCHQSARFQLGRVRCRYPAGRYGGCRMNSTEIPFLSAYGTGLLPSVHGKYPPVEAADAYLDRIDAVGDKLNAYITVCADEARADAKRLDEEAASGSFRGPLHGVPVGVKDQIYTAGIRTTDASKIRADFVPDYDATVVSKLKDAGAVIIGKTNMSEFALGDPISSFTGPARNPWDTARNPGTSSTGSGSATAGFLCATSLGEDTGGSIRGPAANSGLVGIRPTWGG